MIDTSKCPKCGKEQIAQPPMADTIIYRCGSYYPLTGTRRLYEDEQCLRNQLTQASDSDWPEDYDDDNGRYSNRCSLCGVTFTGHKRRVICRKCYNPDELPRGTHRERIRTGFQGTKLFNGLEIICLTRTIDTCVP